MTNTISEVAYRALREPQALPVTISEGRKEITIDRVAVINSAATEIDIQIDIGVANRKPLGTETFLRIENQTLLVYGTT